MTTGALNVALSAEIAADPSEVWAAIGNFQDMSWHPAVHSSTGTGGNAVPASRTLTLGAADGPKLTEALAAHDDATMSYGYRITDVDLAVIPVTNYASTIAVSARSGGGTVINWQGTFDRGDPGGNPPENLNDTAAIGAITGVYQGGLDALIERFGAA